MEKVAVYGTGTIGACLATLTSGYGLETVIVGYSEKGLERCKNTIESNWDLLINEGLANEESKKQALELVHITNDPSKLEGCTFVFEAVLELTDTKKEVYSTINKYAADNVIIGSCTSSLDSSILASITDHPERLLITHPFQPAHMNPLVEIVLHDGTSEETLQRSQELLKFLNREVVVLKKSIPGFIVNRLAWTLFRECLNMLESEVTTPEDINTAVKYAIGKRYANIGLMEYYDDLGFVFVDTVNKNIYPDLSRATETQKLTKEGLDSGNTGRLAGKGLIDWSKKDIPNYLFRKQEPFLHEVDKWPIIQKNK